MTAPTLDAVHAAERAGLVTVRPHPSLPLVVVNYTDRCTYERAWSDLTLQCRGLVLHSETGEVVARGFDKFFNLGEPGAFEPPAREAPIMTVKHDGSLGIGFEFDGATVWTTRGAFDSPHAADATRLWREVYSGVATPKGCSLLVEIISPVTRNVVLYDHEALVVLGVRERDGEEWPHGEVERWAARNGFPMTPRVLGCVAELAARAAGMDATAEGFVARWQGGRVKIKSAGYLAVARFLQGINERRVADCWYAGRKDLVEHHAIADDLRDQIAEQWAALDAAAADAETQLAALVAEVRDWTRKDVALQYDRHPLFSCLMRRLGGGPADVRLHVYRGRFEGHRPRAVTS